MMPELPARPGIDEFRLRPKSPLEVRDFTFPSLYYQQYYRDIVVDGSSLHVDYEFGELRRVVVRFLAELDVDVVPRVKERQASKLARERFLLRRGKQVLARHARLVIETSRPCEACPLEPHLMWRFFEPGPPETTMCYEWAEVDAQTGRASGIYQNCVVD